MAGFLIALSVGLAAILLGNTTLEAGFILGSTFLWIWYCVWTCFVGATYTLAKLVGASSDNGVLKAVEQSQHGSGLGIRVGGRMLIRAMGITALSASPLLLGSYLLMVSGSADQLFSEFNMGKLLAGSALVLLGLILSKKEY